ncbi:hypothetical protein AB0P19_03670 [Microbacterium oleivorans]
MTGRGSGHEANIYPHADTTGLVVVIWALAGPALAQLFEQAIDQVSSF